MSKNNFWAGLATVASVVGLILLDGFLSNRSGEAYDARYDENWPDTASRAKKMNGGRCSLYPNLPANQVHHVRYRDERGPVAGREKPGRDVFPVSNKAHKELHSAANWKKDWMNPAQGNRGTEEMTSRLQRGYWSNVRKENRKRRER